MRTGSLRAALANLRWLLGGRGVAAVLSLVYLAIVTRSLGPAGFGQFALVTGLASTIVAIVGFQTWQIVVRYGTGHLHAGSGESLARLIKTVIALDLIGAMLGSMLAAVAIILLSPSFGWSGEVQRDAFLFCCVTLVAIRSTPIGILRLHDRFGAAAAADTAMPVARLVGALTALALGPSVRAFLIAWAAAEVVSSLAFWIAAVRTARGLPWRRSKVSLSAIGAENPGIFHFAMVTNGGQTLTLTTRQLPVLLVGYFSAPAAAGAYRLAHQLGRSIARVSQLFARALFPELMRIRTTAGSSAEFGPIIGRIVRTAAIGGGAVILLLLLVGKPLLILIAGPEFERAYPLLLLLASAAVLEMIGVGFEPALIASGQAGRSFAIQAFAAFVMVVLMLVLIPLLGPAGAATAVLAGTLIATLLLGIAARKVLGQGGEGLSADPD